MRAVKTGTALMLEGRPLSYKERQLRHELVKWVTAKFSEKGRPLFVATMNCKQAIPGPSGRVWLDQYRLSKALKVYFKRIDWQVYKNASRRGEKTVERFCVIEGGSTTGKRLHAHALLLAPPPTHMHPAPFTDLLRREWASSPWGMDDILIDAPESPMAAAYYVTKNGMDAVDWFNTRP